MPSSDAKISEPYSDVRCQIRNADLLLFRGRGLIAYALNLADKIARETPTPQKQMPDRQVPDEDAEFRF